MNSFTLLWSIAKRLIILYRTICTEGEDGDIILRALFLWGEIIGSLFLEKSDQFGKSFSVEAFDSLS